MNHKIFYRSKRREQRIIFLSLCSLCSLLFIPSGRAQSNANLVVNVYNFVQGPIANRRVTVTLMEAGPVLAGPWLIAGDYVAQYTGTNGQTVFSNMLEGGYSLSIAGTPSRTFPFGFPSTNGNVNAASLIGYTNTLPMYWSVDQLAALGFPGITGITNGQTNVTLSGSFGGTLVTNNGPQAMTNNFSIIGPGQLGAFSVNTNGTVATENFTAFLSSSLGAASGSSLAISGAGNFGGVVSGSPASAGSNFVTLTQHTNGSGTAGQVYTPIPGALGSPTDDTGAFQAVLNQGGVIWLPPGDYTVTNLWLTNNTFLYAAGLTTFHFKALATNWMFNTYPNTNILIKGINFEGGDYSDFTIRSGSTNRAGLQYYVDNFAMSGQKAAVEDCQFYGWSLHALDIVGTNAPAAGQTWPIALFSGIQCQSNHTGISVTATNSTTGPEYVRFVNCFVHACRFGVRSDAGNVTWTACNFLNCQNMVQIQPPAGVNDTHGKFVNCLINHTAVGGTAVLASGIVKGEEFVGCYFAADNTMVNATSCKGLVFTECVFSGDPGIDFFTSTGPNYIVNCRYSGTWATQFASITQDGYEVFCGNHSYDTTNSNGTVDNDGCVDIRGSTNYFAYGAVLTTNSITQTNVGSTQSVRAGTNAELAIINAGKVVSLTNDGTYALVRVGTTNQFSVSQDRGIGAGGLGSWLGGSGIEAWAQTSAGASIIAMDTSGTAPIYISRNNSNGRVAIKTDQTPASTAGVEFWYGVAGGGWTAGTQAGAVCTGSAALMNQTNALANWPAAPLTPGGFAMVNSNGSVYFLTAGGGSASWTATNKIAGP